jgi:hypothetical protein
MIFKIVKKTFPDISKGEWFFCNRITNEIEFNTGLISAEFIIWIKCPVVCTAGFALFSYVTILVEELKVTFVFEDFIDHILL